MNLQVIGIVLMIVGSLTTFASGISLLAAPEWGHRDVGQERQMQASLILGIVALLVGAAVQP